MGGSPGPPDLKRYKMSIVLYKPGNSHIIRGVPCEYRICKGRSLKQHLDDGWFISPEECYPEESEEDKEEDAIRKAAKEAGISNWYNKGIDKLVEELETIKEL